MVVDVLLVALMLLSTCVTMWVFRDTISTAEEIASTEANALQNNHKISYHKAKIAQLMLQLHYHCRGDSNYGGGQVFNTDRHNLICKIKHFKPCSILLVVLTSSWQCEGRNVELV